MDGLGTIHIVDNIFNNLVEAVPELDDCVTGLEKVGDLVRRPASQARLFARCFNYPAGFVLQRKIKKYKSKVHRKRWGSIAFATKRMRKIIPHLKTGWCKNAYGGGSRPEGQEGAAMSVDEFRVSVEKVDSYIQSNHWLGCMVLIEHFNAVFRALFHWTEWCEFTPHE